MSEIKPVALSIQAPNMSQGTAISPLQALDTIAQIQQRSLQNQLTMRTLQARENLGQIWATSPPDQLYSNLSRSPDIAFFPEMATLARQADLATTQISREQTGMTKDASDAWGKSLTGLYMDPYPSQERFNALTQATADTIANPVAKGNFLRHATDIGQSLIAGLPSEEAMRANPQLAAQANDLVKRRILGQIGATVGGWDAISGAILGGPMTTIADRPFVRPFTAPGTIQQMPVGTPMIPGMSPTQATAAATTAAPQVPETQAGAAPTALSDGKPLWTGSLAGRAIPAPTSINPVTGQATYDPAVQRNIDARMDEFGKKDLDKLNGSQNVLGQTESIRDAFNQLQRAGGWWAPGPGLQWRRDIINRWNVLRQQFNLPAEGNLPAEAAFTDLQKQQTQMGFAALSQFFGMGREAMMTVQASMRAVPGIDNTFLGGQLVNRMIEMAAEREIDKHAFLSNFAAANHGNLLNAEDEFNKERPIKNMVQSVLSEFGMGERGFTGANKAATEHNIGIALQRGYLTPQQALNLRHGQPADYQATQTPVEGGGVSVPLPGSPQSALAPTAR